MKINVKKFEKDFRNHTRARMETVDLYGASCRIYKDGKLITELYEGYTNSKKNTPLTKDSMFRLASMTKPITAAAILICEQQGLLSIFDSVSRYIPEYAEIRVAERDEKGNLVAGDKVDIKIYECLNHTCGIFNGFPVEINGVIYKGAGEIQLPDFTEDKRPDVTTAVMNYPKYLLGFRPGSAASYCSYAGCDICAEIVTRVTGMPFEQFYEEKIFKPLGMVNTTFTPNEEQWSKLVAMPAWSNGEKVERDMGEHIFEKFSRSYHSAGAGLVSNIEDYSKFMLMIAGKGVYEGKRILTEESINKMRIPYVRKCTKGLSSVESWGLGVRVTRDNLILPDGCFGWSGAYGTHYWVDPENGIAAIYMKNSGTDGGSEAKTAREFEQDVMNAAEDI